MVTASPPQKNIVIIGGSCAAMGAALTWGEKALESHRLIIIDVKSHFNHVFAFPRAAVKSGFERELFVPYHNLFGGDDRKGKVLHARVTKLFEHHVELDREVPEFGTKVEFDYLIYGAGTKIPAPGRLAAETKAAGIDTLKKYQKAIEEAERPVVIGAGAVGIELAAEIKEHYPEKHVTLLHSRSGYLPRFKKSVDVMTYNILKKHGVKQILGDRVILPEQGFPLEVKPIEIHTRGGRVIQSDLAIMCIGMTPNSQLLAELSPKSINSDNKFVKVKPTMQIQDDQYPHIFAAGDVLDHTDVKTGHFAWVQGIAALNNIMTLINGGSQEDLRPYVSYDVALIRLILGNKEAVMQTNMLGPLVTAGSWIAGRNIPDNIYAARAWAWVRTPLDEEHADL
ncbi:uncharacterized protein BYT42DRAFT_563718 [Radiomyces spectabilis]|uniref:uncharacterized protein n=1 Tax=Radiomyces spectabilis TaxID=64574 RepID=UPI00221F8555|nr:uncharacterized protein BYT42DRAFT_563718 [Radiomyces spectabilis]KAI8384810.1 hypothetical protein BYT42DRAFT_563718 [Radiomyces spectabilis]